MFLWPRVGVVYEKNQTEVKDVGRLDEREAGRALAREGEGKGADYVIWEKGKIVIRGQWKTTGDKKGQKH